MGKYQLTVEEKQQLDQQGHIVIPDVLSEEEINHYRPRILELAEIEQQNGLGLVHWLVNKGKEFERLVAHPRVVPYFEYMLGSDYILSPLTPTPFVRGPKMVDTTSITLWVRYESCCRCFRFLLIRFGYWTISHPKMMVLDLCRPAICA